MSVFRTPKGWTGPRVVDNLPVEGTFRSHQVPLTGARERREQLNPLEEWMRGYRPEEVFDERGKLREELAELAPEGQRRMGAKPHANGGALLKNMWLPDFRDYAVEAPQPGAVDAEDTRVLGRFLLDVVKLNQEPRTFRLFGPDETNSNRLGAVFEVTERQWTAEIVEGDGHLAREGSVMEVLAEHLCQARGGWRATCSRAVMGCSPPTRLSPTLWTQGSTSTPSG